MRTIPLKIFVASLTSVGNHSCTTVPKWAWWQMLGTVGGYCLHIGMHIIGFVWIFPGV